VQPAPERRISIIGAGLAGSLLALLLARRGWAVDVYERRPDPRKASYAGGRSINLALAERGLHALRLAGLQDVVMAQAVMMRGRMVHALDGGTQLLRYGRDDSEVIWSVHRGRLNLSLVDAAEAAGATLHFDARLEAVDFEARRAVLVDERDGARREIGFDVLLGADGAGSGLRAAIGRVADLGERFVPLGHGYRELEIPPAPDGGFLLDPNALHIWPRGVYMCIALPNTERTFTVTLFLPSEGDPSFATLPDVAAARALFARDFPDALALMPDFDADWQANPVGQLGTLSLQAWRLDGRALLLGDAAHAMVPFHGQGMNCAFEDCIVLDQCIADADDWDAAFARFEALRRPDAEAIQAMALENYVEMRDQVDDAAFLRQRALERILAERHPGRFVPRYSMVSFSRVPYSVAFARGKVQREILVECTDGVGDVSKVDLERADRMVVERLAMLEGG
jgi:kynurenine 3-monooxygenase